jgi:hypothetical protein
MFPVYRPSGYDVVGSNAIQVENFFNLEETNHLVRGTTVVADVQMFSVAEPSSGAFFDP